MVCSYKDHGDSTGSGEGIWPLCSPRSPSLCRPWAWLRFFLQYVCMYVCVFNYLYICLLWVLVVGSLIFDEACGIFFFSCRMSGASQVVLVVKNPPASAGEIRDVGSIPGSGRSPGRGHSNPFQYSCLENPMDREVWGAIVQSVSESQTRLKRLSTHTKIHQFQYAC